MALLFHIPRLHLSTHRGGARNTLGPGLSSVNTRLGHMKFEPLTFAQCLEDLHCLFGLEPELGSPGPGSSSEYAKLYIYEFQHDS
jgi:hypothetical protein